jgi:hypothetical protein
VTHQVSYETDTRGSTVFATQLSIIIQRPFNLHFEFYTQDMQQILPSLPSAGQPHLHHPHQTPLPGGQLSAATQPPSFAASTAASASATTSGIGAPPSQSADLSSLLASQNLSASMFLSAPLSQSPVSASVGSAAAMLLPPAISLASSAELTSTILVEEMATDEDGYGS